MSSEGRTIQLDRPVVDIICDPSSDNPGANREEQLEAYRELQKQKKELEKREKALQQERHELKEKRESAAATVEQLMEIADSARGSKEQLMEEHEQDMVDLCLQMSEKVLQHEIEHGRYKIEEILQSAIKTVRDTTSATVKLNPRDHEVAESYVEEIRESQNIESVTIVPDDRVEPGGCHIETESGTVLSEVSDRLAKIEKELLKDGDTG